MTVLSLQTQNEGATLSESERLRRAWLYANALWELAANNPEAPEGLTEEESEAHCDATTDALNAYMLHPSEDWQAFAIKMRVFRDEEIHDGWATGNEIVRRLTADANRLAFGIK